MPSFTPTTSKGRTNWCTGLRRILHAQDQAEARKMFHHLQQSLQGKANKALELLEEDLEDAIAVLTLPEKYHRRLRTTNMVERLNEEIRRREKVVRIFPNERAAFRLLGALLAEQHKIWSTGRKYLNMEDYWQWRQQIGHAESSPLSVAK
jgi:putative transposase